MDPPATAISPEATPPAAIAPAPPPPWKTVFADSLMVLMYVFMMIAFAVPAVTVDRLENDPDSDKEQSEIMLPAIINVILGALFCVFCGLPVFDGPSLPRAVVQWAGNAKLMAVICEGIGLVLCSLLLKPGGVPLHICGSILCLFGGAVCAMKLFARNAGYLAYFLWFVSTRLLWVSGSLILVNGRTVQGVLALAFVVFTGISIIISGENLSKISHFKKKII